MNSGKAVIRGLEGKQTIPILGENGDTLCLSNNLTYRITNKSTNIRLGVNNLFDKRLHREVSGSGQGANTYNEPGCQYYTTLTASL